MSTKAKLDYDDTSYEMPIVEGSYAERAIRHPQPPQRHRPHHARLGVHEHRGDEERDHLTSTAKRASFSYRGYPIEQLAEESTFVETSYLLIFGELPSPKAARTVLDLLTYHSMLHEDMRHFFDGFPSNAHPMAILSSMVSALSAYYPDSIEPDTHNITHIARRPVEASDDCRVQLSEAAGAAVAYPKNSLDYCANFLHMMFSHPAERHVRARP